MVSKKDALHQLMRFIQEVGIPQSMISDNAPEGMHGQWGQICAKHHIQQN